MKTAYERFAAKFERLESGCWQWTGAVQSKGYGAFSEKGLPVLAHRWSYEHHVGPIRHSMTVDHLCRNRRCVNPGHMEIVSLYENSSRANRPMPLPLVHPLGPLFEEAETNTQRYLELLRHEAGLEP